MLKKLINDERSWTAETIGKEETWNHFLPYYLQKELITSYHSQNIFVTGINNELIVLKKYIENILAILNDGRGFLIVDWVT